MFKARSELMCCGESVPIRTIRQHGGFEDEYLEGFRLWLQEHHAPNPTYCPWEECFSIDVPDKQKKMSIRLSLGS